MPGQTFNSASSPLCSSSFLIFGGGVYEHFNSLSTQNTTKGRSLNVLACSVGGDSQ